MKNRENIDSAENKFLLKNNLDNGFMNVLRIVQKKR